MKAWINLLKGGGGNKIVSVGQVRKTLNLIAGFSSVTSSLPSDVDRFFDIVSPWDQQVVI